MTDVSAHLANVRQQVMREVSPFMEHFARLGYAAKGVVYLIVGGLAAMVAGGMGGQTTGSHGAMETLAHQPFGRVMLAIIAAGLSGYSLWQFIRAVEDPEGAGDDAKGISKRIGYFCSGVGHLFLIFYALTIIIGYGGSGDASGNESARSLSGQAMNYPLGRWAVGVVGAGIVCYGCYQLFRAFKGKLDKQLRLYRIRAEAQGAVVTVSRFGIAARGIVFGIVGVFLIIAAKNYNPHEARGVGGALHALEEQAYGPWLLAIVALGLIAYGIYEFIRAFYRQIKPA